MKSRISMFTAQNWWNKRTIKVRPAPQCQYRKRETTCIMSCPTSSVVNCKKVPSLRIVIDSPSHFMDEATLACNILFTFIWPALYSVHIFCKILEYVTVFCPSCKLLLLFFVHTMNIVKLSSHPSSYNMFTLPQFGWLGYGHIGWNMLS